MREKNIKTFQVREKIIKAHCFYPCIVENIGDRASALKFYGQ